MASGGRNQQWLHCSPGPGWRYAVFHGKPLPNSLVPACDLQHHLTFPQLCRESIAFPRIYDKLIAPLPFPAFSELFDFCPTVYIYIVF
jgi:hypothetical protein